MLYRFYRHKHDTNRELVFPDGAEFPVHLNSEEWFLHETRMAVNARLEGVMAARGYCDRPATPAVGEKLSTGHHPNVMRKTH